MCQDNGLFKDLARYLVERQDLALWTRVLKPEGTWDETNNTTDDDGHHDDVKNTDFIILEYLEGKFPTEITEPTELTQYLKLLVTFITIQIWFFSYYHTDLHTGNILCIKDNDGNSKLGIIDFGMNIICVNLSNLW